MLLLAHKYAIIAIISVLNNLAKGCSMQQKSELLVITKANDLCRYVLTVTEKSPKRFRFTLTGRMQNLTLDLIEALHRANEVFVYDCRGELCSSAYEKRLNYQHTALTSLKLLGVISHIAYEQGCILSAQYEQISKQIYNCQNLLGAWINSDKKRYKL